MNFFLSVVAIFIITAVLDVIINTFFANKMASLFQFAEDVMVQKYGLSSTDDKLKLQKAYKDYYSDEQFINRASNLLGVLQKMMLGSISWLIQGGFIIFVVYSVFKWQLDNTPILWFFMILYFANRALAIIISLISKVVLNRWPSEPKTSLSYANSKEFMERTW